MHAKTFIWKNYFQRKETLLEIPSKTQIEENEIRITA